MSAMSALESMSSIFIPIDSFDATVWLSLDGWLFCSLLFCVNEFSKFDSTVTDSVVVSFCLLVSGDLLLVHPTIAIATTKHVSVAIIFLFFIDSTPVYAAVLLFLRFAQP